jgi:hypothetical protein
MTLQTVEVRDASTERVVLSLAGDDLARNMNPVGTPADGTAREPGMASSGTSIVWINATVPTRDAIPRKTGPSDCWDYFDRRSAEPV